MKKKNTIYSMVQQAYAKTALKASSCCTKSCCCNAQTSSELAVPEAELGLSCGDPVAFSKLKKGMVVLDLGSGAGKDVFIAAKIVGARGKVIGIDMTDEMMNLAKKNLKKFISRTGLSNVEFRKGFIEKLPVKNNEVDIVISNCVINLSPDKIAVFREAFRVLKPGGKIVVSDIVLNRELPEKIKNSASLYSACLSGALLRKDYLSAIKKAGFTGIKILSDKIYSLASAGIDPITSEMGRNLEGTASSITISANKPQTKEK